MKAAAGSLHGVIDTVSAKHDLSYYMTLLRPANGKYVVVGVPPEPYELHASALIFSKSGVILVKQAVPVDCVLLA